MMWHGHTQPPNATIMALSNKEKEARRENSGNKNLSFELCANKFGTSGTLSRMPLRRPEFEQGFVWRADMLQSDYHTYDTGSCKIMQALDCTHLIEWRVNGLVDQTWRIYTTGLEFCARMRRWM